MPKFSHLTNTAQIERTWLEAELFPMCERIRKWDGKGPDLTGRSLYCLFYEPSLLTRTSFERAMGLLGGQSYHTEDASQFFPVTSPNYVDNVVNILASLHVDMVVLRCSDDGVVERAEFADALPIINGGSLEDHPTQALADIYTLHRELGGVDGAKVVVVGRLEHRNVNALLKGLALFKNVKATLIPLSGQADPDVVAYCEKKGMEITLERDMEAVRDADAIYLNAPRTVAHVQLLRSRHALDLTIDKKFMSMLKPNCVIMDPMQRSGDFSVEVADERLAFYRQSENGLIVRMAVLAQTLS
ncbi:MAG: hypothetical protein BZY79_06320 [SAR202 cluster bacterium Casp-Chloro-G4]|nr:hypothetical protein [Chloroflexota bacterium]PKB60953.1 MAG: hypothetical protein BZY79_06320 [SAR202 cluster bacterium Casp-Chloro-G4]